MTPQERQLVDDLFDRLAQLENVPRDADAERLIADGAKRAPHAVYALVQTALVQDEALKRANARIEELQGQLSAGEEPQQRQGSFLDSMRDAAFGRREGRGSVPQVRPQSTQSSLGEGPGNPSEAGNSSPMPAPAVPPQAYPTETAAGSGGSFLGTAASAAAGVIGGALLLDGIRSMFGHHPGFGGHDPNASGSVGDHASPWGGGAAGGDHARDAQLEDAGHGGTDAANEQAERGGDDSFDTADEENVADEGDFGDDGGFGDDDSDFA
jgi:uncharacterized protein